MTDSLLTIREMCDAFGSRREPCFYETKELLAPRRRAETALLAAHFRSGSN
ncbi:MAG: hypothetical protein R3D80_20900 [Paracoccaceae bacterium]